MQTYYEAKDMLKKELDEIVKKGELSAGSLDTVDKLLNSMKNACKLIMYEEYAEDGYSYADSDADMADYSYARGRGRGARRDSMGRYSREGGYSNARGGRGGYSRSGGYSYADKEEKVEILRDMMDDAKTDEERRVIEKLMRRMERE